MAQYLGYGVRVNPNPEEKSCGACGKRGTCAEARRPQSSGLIHYRQGRRKISRAGRKGMTGIGEKKVDTFRIAGACPREKTINATFRKKLEGEQERTTV